MDGKGREGMKVRGGSERKGRDGREREGRAGHGYLSAAPELLVTPLSRTVSRVVLYTAARHLLHTAVSRCVSRSAGADVLFVENTSTYAVSANYSMRR